MLVEMNKYLYQKLSSQTKKQVVITESPVALSLKGENVFGLCSPCPVQCTAVQAGWSGHLCLFICREMDTLLHTAVSLWSTQRRAKTKKIQIISMKSDLENLNFIENCIWLQL